MLVTLYHTMKALDFILPMFTHMHTHYMHTHTYTQVG